MPKTNDEIRRSYGALPWYKQVGVAAADIANIAGNGVTFGQGNRFADWVLGNKPGTAANLHHEATVRAGLAGDVANVGSMLLGGRGVLAAGQKAVGAVRAAPAAVQLAKTAGPGTAARYMLGTAGPGIVPAAKLAAPKLSTIAKGTGIAALLGLSASGRQDATPAQAVEQPKALAKAPTIAAVAKDADRTPTPQERQLAFVDSLFRGPLTMREAQMATGMLPAAGKPRSSKDIVTGDAAALSQAIFQNDIANAEKLAESDPEGARALTAKAMEAEFSRRAGLAGLNPMNLAQASMMQGDPEGE